MYHLPHWDGKDRILELANRVPCDNPHWAPLFRRWFLNMVAHWRGMDKKHANSTSPLLIGPQAYRKSTFCRMLLPPALQAYYTDSIDFSRKRDAELYLNRFLLINMDEFDQISPTQQAFLKHILQKPVVNTRRPNASAVEELRRYASFIATSNHRDLLTDTSGSRRFIGIYMTGAIDVSRPIDYEQLYAQALELLYHNERYWFDSEEEADRIGIQVLQRSGFDPQAMPMFMGKLLDESRYSTRPPEMLLTHPLPESRLADARNRANQMRPVVVQSSADFYLAKARTLGMYTNGDNKLGTDLLNAWDKGNIRQQHAAQYGRALLAMESNNFDQARKTLQPLLNADPQNAWYLDLATDIDLGQKKTSDAINRLKNARELRTNPVLQLNLANALLQGGQPGEAATILNRYTFTYKEDGNGWDLLAQAEGALGNRDQELAARAESMALVGQLEQAISLLSSASSQVKLGSLQQARYDARIDQLRDLQARFRPYQKM